MTGLAGAMLCRSRDDAPIDPRILQKLGEALGAAEGSAGGVWNCSAQGAEAV